MPRRLEYRRNRGLGMPSRLQCWPLVSKRILRAMPRWNVPATFDEARLYAVPAGIVFGYQCVSFVQVQAWFSRTRM